MVATILPREIRCHENDMGKATVPILCIFSPDRVFFGRENPMMHELVRRERENFKRI